MQWSKAADKDTVRKQENKEFEMMHNKKLDAYVKQLEVYNDNQGKAYAVLWDRRAKAMQHRVSQRADYESQIFDKSIALLKAIKEHSLNYQETRYDMLIISDAFRALFNTKQKEGESLQDYTRRFKTACDILESHVGGPIGLVKYVENMKTRNLLGSNAMDNDYCEKAGEQFMALAYLENSDQDKYGSLSKSLNQQKSLENDQYPKTMTSANSALSLHPFDIFKKKENKQNNHHDAQKKTNEKED